MKIKFLESFTNLIRFNEHQKFIQIINYITIFTCINIYKIANFYNLLLNFSLKNISFNKKKALSFFLAVEYLTNQKCIATLSSKNILEWKLRKGALVGCKVTLRKKNLFEFLDILVMSLPRMEKFKRVQILQKSKNNLNYFNLKLFEIILFFPIELGLGINTEVKQLDINFIFSTLNIEEQKFLLMTYKIPLI